MSEFDTSSAALSAKDHAWSAMEGRIDVLVRLNAENPVPAANGAPRSRQMIAADFYSSREGAPMYGTWLNASTEPIRKLIDMPVHGPIGQIVDGLIAHGGKEVRQKDPALTEAAAVTKFLGTQDGQTLYEVGRSLPAGATFEGNPKAISRALAIVRELVIEKGTRRFVAEFPLTLKMSGLLKACDRA